MATARRKWPVRARGRERKPPGSMNKTEQKYALHLEVQKRMGEVLWYEYEAVKLRLARSTFYTPDFMVMLPDGQIELHEVKGFWEDDARVKIKAAAERFPFKFLAVMANRDGWNVEEF